MPQGYFADKTALIDHPVTIGEGTKVWSFSHVMSGAVIGRNCVLGQNVMVASKARLGDGVHVQNNVSIYDYVTLGDHVFCGPSAVFTNVINPRSEFPRKHEYRKTLVKRGATIGANATICCGHVLGEYCFIGAGAVVTCDVPAFSLMLGVPARRAGWVSRFGERLHFGADGCAVCHATGDVYRLERDTVVLARVSRHLARPRCSVQSADR